MIGTLVLAATGCQMEVEPVNGPPLADSVRSAEVHMHQRFGAARRIEAAIADGDLAGGEREARALSRIDEPEALPRWSRYLDRIAAAARRVEGSLDVVAAAKATASLGRECGRCHEEIAAKVVFSVEPRPANDAKLPQQMLTHQWGATQMWEGLIGPSDERWLAGAQALAQARLTIVAEEPMTVVTRDWVLPEGDKIGDDVARVRLYATRALDTADHDGRAEIFGDLLGTCVHCHAAIRDR